MRRFLPALALLLSGLVQAAPSGAARPERFAYASTVAQIELRLAPLCASLRLRMVHPLPAAMPRASHAARSRHLPGCDGRGDASPPQPRPPALPHDPLDLAWILVPEPARTALVEAIARSAATSLEIPLGNVSVQLQAAVRRPSGGAVLAAPRGGHGQAMVARLLAGPSTPVSLKKAALKEATLP